MSQVDARKGIEGQLGLHEAPRVVSIYARRLTQIHVAVTCLEESFYPTDLRTGFACITHRKSHLGSMFGSSECGNGADVASWSKNDYRSHLLRQFCLIAA